MIAAIVLAAGQSRRCGENKLLAKVGGKPVVLHAVDAALDGGAAPVVVVLGHQAARLRRVLAGRAVRGVFNPDYGSGFAASLKTGLAAVWDFPLRGLLLCLGDMPLIGPEHVAALIDAYQQAGANRVCIPEHAGSLGHPRLFPPRLLPGLMTAEGDGGPKVLLDTEDILRLPMDEAVIADVDTKTALRAIQARTSGPAAALIARDQPWEGPKP
jgi:molybdenum cofactor cytidylyltransferase